MSAPLMFTANSPSSWSLQARRRAASWRS